MIQPEHVYFAFPDGRLSYDCVTCGAKCCHGMGFEVLAGRELDALVATTHAVRFFLDPCEAGVADHLHARNLKPFCFFLTEQNLCAIQVEHGYDAKPETCRLFPFNMLTRAGDYLIVAPHTSLCPLAVLAPDERSDLSRHERLLAALNTRGIGTHVPEVRADGDVSRLVALERRIAGLYDDHFDDSSYARFAAEQLALTRSGAADVSDDERTRAREEVDRFLGLLYEVLDAQPPPVNDPAIVRTMAGSTPAIRSRLVFGENVTKPRDVERIPFFLLALHALARFAREAGMQAVTYQTLMGLFDSLRPLLSLLSDVDRVLAWAPHVRIDFAITGNKTLQASYIGVAKALLLSAQRKSPRPLGYVLRDHAPSEGMDRITLLKMVARRVNGTLVPLGDVVNSGTAWRHPRAVAQQLAMGMLGADVLTLIADKQRARAARRSSQ